MESRSKALRDEQGVIIQGIYAARADGDEPKLRALNARYEGTVAELLGIHGADAPVCLVDVDLAMHFGQCWKSDFGAKPDGTHTREGAKAFLESHR